MTKQSLNDIRHSFLTISSDIRIRDSFELRMLEENKINGLLDLSVCDDDGILNLNFDITGKEPLSGLVTVHKLTASDIRHIILCLKHVLSGLEPYLLSGNGIVLSAESVYMDPVTFSPSFLYLPGRNEAFSAGLTSFLQSILSAVDHEDYNSVVLAYRLFKESENDVNAIDHLEQMLITPDIPDSSPAPEPVSPPTKDGMTSKQIP